MSCVHKLKQALHLWIWLNSVSVKTPLSDSARKRRRASAIWSVGADLLDMRIRYACSRRGSIRQTPTSDYADCSSPKSWRASAFSTVRLYRAFSAQPVGTNGLKSLLKQTYAE